MDSLILVNLFRWILNYFVGQKVEIVNRLNVNQLLFYMTTTCFLFMAPPFKESYFVEKFLFSPGMTLFTI